MCGRYQFSTESQELSQIERAARRRAGTPLDKLNFLCSDISPTSSAPVLIADGIRVVADIQRWGIPGWNGRLIINARAETVCEKPMFRCNIVGQRCAIPASGYYEWDRSRHKYFFSLPEQPIYFAGIYNSIEESNCFVILTTKPNESVKQIHNRMPLILLHDQVRPWLTDPVEALTLLALDPPPLQRICADGQISLFEN